MRIDEIGEITDYVQESAGMNADIIWGNTLDNSLEDKLAITIIATGFGNDSVPELAALEMEEKISHTLNDEVEIKSKRVEPQPNSWDNQGNEDVPFEVIDKEVDSDGDLFNFGHPIKDNDVERFELFSDDKSTPPKQSDFEITSGYSSPEGDGADKTQKQRISYKTENDIEQLENEPAFKRKNIKLDDIEEINSPDEEISRYTLSDKEGTPKLRENNSFLNPELD